MSAIGLAPGDRKVASAPAPRAHGRAYPWTAAHDWPKTTRVMPWLVASFIAMLFLFPFDATELPVHLPFNSQLDRLLIVVMLVIWLCSLALGGEHSPRLKWSFLHGSLFAFLIVAFLSVVVNIHTLTILGQSGLASKKIALMISYFLLFAIATSVLRPSEVQVFSMFILGLACLTALGTIYEGRTHSNIFYSLAALVPGAKVATAPVLAGLDAEGRYNITGPTGHGLAVTTMMAMVLPFALIVMTGGGSRRRKAFGIIAAALLMGAAVSTERKTAFVAPVVAVLIFVAYRPATIKRLIPLALVMAVLVHIIAPGSLGSVLTEFTSGSATGSASTAHRVNDYSAVWPDIQSHIVIGRGFGTYDPHIYRFLDNEYLMMLITVGVVGTAVWLVIILGVIGTAHRTIRSRDPRRAPPALAAAAGAGVFAVTNALFDAVSFPQAPYLFLVLAALAVTATRRDAEEHEHLSERWPPSRSVLKRPQTQRLTVGV